MVREDSFQARYREIGAILAKARAMQKRSVSECAALLGTSRRRYVAMEHGKAIIGIAELEELMRYLNIPSDTIWPEAQGSAEPGKLIMRTLRGEVVRVSVEIDS